MTTEGGLLLDILCHPDDPAPRLVYSDWLEEQGDPRAEWVRQGCEVLRHPRGGPDRELARDSLRRAYQGAGYSWPEMEGLPLNWAGLVCAARYRLAEAMTWCAGRGLPLRSPELAPGPSFRELAEGLDPPGHLWNQSLWGVMVQKVALRRGELLAAQGRAPRALPDDLAGGRLLAYLPGQRPRGATNSRSTGEYLNERLVPGWDTWVMYGREAPPNADAFGAPESYVLAWAPPHLIAIVERARQGDPSAPLFWADELDRPFIRELRQAGLLRSR